jgi:hypothetical protein
MDELKLTTYGIGKTITAKKEHYCTMCKGIIKVNDQYTFYRKEYCGNKWCEYICADCINIPTYYKEHEYESISAFISINTREVIIDTITDAHVNKRLTDIEFNRLIKIINSPKLSIQDEIYVHKKLYYKVLNK